MDITTDYEPSQDTKEWWLYTRKSGKKFNDITLPGLFITDSYTNDRNLFATAMAIEFAGMGILVALAEANIIIFGTILALIVIDVILAIVLHRKKREICEAKNQIEYWRYQRNYKLNDVANDRLVAWEKKLGELQGWIGGKVAIFFIWVFAIVKASAFFVLNSGGSVYAALVLLLYLVVAYIHSSHTGYCLAHWWFMIKFRKEQNAHLDAIRLGKETRDTIKEHRFESIVPYKDEIMVSNGSAMEVRISRLIDNNDPKVEKENAIYYDKARNTWMFKTWGLLKDEDLYSLAYDKDAVTSARDFIAIEGLKIQLAMLQQNAKQ